MECLNSKIMKKIITISILLTLILPILSKGQRWKRHRYEIMPGIALSNLQGDLGGSNTDAIYMLDYDLLATRLALGIGLRYKIQENIAAKVNIIGGMLNGSDNYTKSPSREPRHISANVFLFELSAQGEYSVIKEKLSTRYTFRNMGDFKLRNVNTYLFAGIGGFYFRTKIKNEGSPNANINNAPLSFILAIPVGVGFKYGINKKYSLGVEFGYRKTFSDYIDKYHSEQFSKAKDVYMFLMVNFVRKVAVSRSGLPTF